jgi:hypothetical protein
MEILQAQQLQDCLLDLPDGHNGLAFSLLEPYGLQQASSLYDGDFRRPFFFGYCESSIGRSRYLFFPGTTV